MSASAPLTPLPSAVATMLRDDGYDIVDLGLVDDERVISIVAQPGACPDCLVPKDMMLMLLRKALGSSEIGPIRLLYPGEASAHPTAGQ